MRKDRSIVNSGLRQMRLLAITAREHSERRILTRKDLEFLKQIASDVDAYNKYLKNIIKNAEAAFSEE